MLSSFDTSYGFKINSNSLCRPSFAATKALKDLKTTKKGIGLLTSSKISSNINSVLRQGLKETILRVATKLQSSQPDPCQDSKSHNTMFSPSSYKDLRSIVSESARKGFAFFKLIRKNGVYLSESGLHIAKGICDENTTNPTGCLNMETLDDANCCDRKTVFELRPELPYFDLCTGAPQETLDTSRLISKRNALFAGLRLVETLLPKAVRSLIQLKTRLNIKKIEENIKRNSSFWAAPTPATDRKNKNCLPVQIDLFSSPPTFTSNQLITPAEYKRYEQNLDSLQSYLEYLRLVQPKLENNEDFSHIRFVNNNLTPMTYFHNLFSFAIVIYTAPVALLTLIVCIISGCFCKKIKYHISAWYTQYASRRAITDFSANLATGISNTFFQAMTMGQTNQANHNQNIEPHAEEMTQFVVRPGTAGRSRAPPPPYIT